jgi:Fur family ferric uptake transcriptional regulator
VSSGDGKAAMVQESNPMDTAAALDVLRGRGARITAARRRVLDALFARGPRRPTAEQIALELPDVDRATVYRTLNLLEEVGVVEHVHLGHGPAVYRTADANTVPALCRGCGELVAIPRTTVDLMVNGERERSGFEIDLGHFALHGRCARCRALGRAAGAGVSPP